MSKSLLAFLILALALVLGGVIYVAGAAGPVASADAPLEPHAAAEVDEPGVPADGAEGPGPALVEGSSLPWVFDVEEARRIAAQGGKHVLVNFTGTGWCHWCARLEKEVFDAPEFEAELSERYVFALLDFNASGEARKDRPFAQKNDALAELFRVSAFPTIVLMTPSGVAYDRLGYEPDGPAPYTARVSEAHDRAKDLEAIVPGVTAMASAATSPEEARTARRRALEVLQDAGSHALARPLAPLVAATLEDPDLETEQEHAAIRTLAKADASDEKLVQRAFQVDPQNAAGLPETVLASALRTADEHGTVVSLIARSEALLEAAPVYDAQVAAELYGHCAYWIKAWDQDAERARILASFALDLKPEDEQLRGMLEDLARP